MPSVSSSFFLHKGQQKAWASFSLLTPHPKKIPQRQRFALSGHGVADLSACSRLCCPSGIFLGRGVGGQERTRTRQGETPRLRRISAVLCSSGQCLCPAIPASVSRENGASWTAAVFSVSTRYRRGMDRLGQLKPKTLREK